MMFSYAVITKKELYHPRFYLLCISKNITTERSQTRGWGRGLAWEENEDKDIRALWRSVHANTSNKTKPLLVRTAATTTSRLWEFVRKAGDPSVSRGLKVHWKNCTVWGITSCKHTCVAYLYSSSPKGNKLLTRTANGIGRVVHSASKIHLPTLPKSCTSCWAKRHQAPAFWNPAYEIQRWVAIHSQCLVFFPKITSAPSRVIIWHSFRKTVVPLAFKVSR